MKFSTLGLITTLAVSAATDVTASTRVGVHIGIGMPAPIIVRTAPPPRAPEVIVVSPGPGYVWVAGHHSWQNGAWVWVPGAWTMPPQAGTVFIEGRWDQGTNSWTPEHWEFTQTTPPPPVAVQSHPTTPPPVIVTGPAAPPPVVIQVAPPPPRFERRAHRPGPGFVWINGYWIYRGGQYVWMSGHWDRAPRGRRVWVEPRWEHRGGSYVFIEGSWR